MEKEYVITRKEPKDAKMESSSDAKDANMESSPDSDYRIHRYPFKTLPLLESHLHPKFVIFEGGRKLESLSLVLKGQETFNDFPTLTALTELYNAWKASPTAEEQEQDSSYNVPVDSNGGDDDDDDDSDYQSGPPSRRKGHLKKRKALAVKPNAAKGKRPRKVLSKLSIHNRQVLSEATLFSLNQRFGRARWTYDCIRDWSKQSRSISRRKKKKRNFIKRTSLIYPCTSRPS